MTALSVFAFGEQMVRISDRDGEPWFVGRDVCAALGHAKPENALGRIPADEKDTLIQGTLGGDQRVTIINEPGMYRLVLTSRTEPAERFKKWIVSEVLPAIRRTGRYAPAEANEPEVDVRAMLGPARLFATRTALQWIREARVLYGASAGRDMWRRCGFPNYAVEAHPARLPRPTPPGPPPSLHDQIVAANAEGRFDDDWRSK